MRVHVHTLCWNDMAMLPFFFRHYEPWVEKFYFFDDTSTDGSREYLERRGDVVVETTPHADPHSWVASAQAIHNRGWKRSIGQADWVIVTNVDEHIYHSHIRQYIQAAYDAGITVLPAPGYQMVTETYPPPDSLLCRDYVMGAPDDQYSRMALFRPDKILETNYTPGRHRARFQGEIVFPELDEVTNLHYKYLGADETFARQAAQAPRLGARDRINDWGFQYHWTRDQFADYFKELKATCVDVTKIAEHSPRLSWWKKPRYPDRATN
jgi:hypothetical protein